MSNDQVPDVPSPAGRTPLTWYILVILICEKIIQHTAVTLAFFYNWNGIHSRVAVNPNILMALGAVLAVLFVVSLWGMIRRQKWAMSLLVGLAIFDIVGEFLAQGVFAIVITISFLVAVAILILTLIYRRQSSIKD